MLEFNEVDKILQQLPVSYYLKRKLEVTLDTSSYTSYLDMYNDKIHIAYTNIKDANCTTEQDIRCLLYHEVSHAFLTPLKLCITDIVNIFEDERIETLCKNYYIDTDFKTFAKKINQYQENFLPGSKREEFFYIVRFRQGKADFVKRVEEIIKKYASLNRQSSNAICNSYREEIYKLYNDISKHFYNKTIDMNNEEYTKEVTDSYDNNASIEHSSTNENLIVKEDDNNAQTNKLFSDSISNSIKSLNKAFKNLYDTNLQNEFKQILNKKNNICKMNGSSINAYSGVFDVRSVARNDYKYFVQKNRAGNAKRFSKLKLNLFIDSSGSFNDSEEVVNKLLINLVALERQTTDFEFDVISMSIGQRILKKESRTITCGGCNDLNSEIFEQFKKVQDSQASNINIIMFDGNAYSDLPMSERETADTFKAFNHSNCAIISNNSNYKYIEKYAFSAKRIYCDNDYAKQLIKSVMNAIHSM